MFTMMNNARLMVGVQGVGRAERALQQATAFALERRQGTGAGASGAGMSADRRAPGRPPHAADDAALTAGGARDLL